MSLRLLSLFLSAVCAMSAHAQTLNDAFSQGTATGRSGNTAARSQINSGTAQSSVPGYTTAAPQTSYFGGTGISVPAAAAANACTGPGDNAEFDAQACNAITFSQTNPTRRPVFSIGHSDPLLAGAKVITADPQAIAGNIAGTYSACTVQTTTTPDRFETALCHQTRSTETLSCDKVLTVTPTPIPGCTAGALLTTVTADPCPSCIDYLAFDFSCGTNSYLMRAYTIQRENGQLYMHLGSQNVPGALNTQIPQTPGPSRFDSGFCYQTHYSQSCSGANCSIGAWFSNPCQGTSYYGVSTFVMPTTVGFTDTWVNQCAALEARSR